MTVQSLISKDGGSQTSFLKPDPINDPTVDLHLKLQSYSYRIPLELIRHNFKTIQKLEERQVKKLEEFKKSLTKNNNNNNENIDSIKKSLLTNLKLFEKKLIKQIKIEEELISRINARTEHLAKLKPLQEKYQTSPSEITKDNLLSWYRDQTNLLIITHLLQNCTQEEDKIGLELMKSLHMEKLVDSDVLSQSSRISQDIKNGELTSLIDWIITNKSYLIKNRSQLEFETRFQEYIELIKANKLQKALFIFQTYLSKFSQTNFDQIKLASSLLLINPNSLTNLLPHNNFTKLFKTEESNKTFNEYISLFSPSRYEFLSEIFKENFFKLNGIPESDPLMVYLSIGISTLKTKSCQCRDIDQSIPIPTFKDLLQEKLKKNNQISMKSEIIKCPVCSPEFKDIASTLPFAHNTKSFLFENPIMLPNGNIYDKERLINFTKLYNIKKTEILQNDDSLHGVIDPIEGKWFAYEDMITVFPS